MLTKIILRWVLYPTFTDEKQWGTEVEHLTKVTCLVEQDSGFEPMPWAQEPGFWKHPTILSPVLSNSNICCILFWNFSSLILDLCKDMVVFPIISTPESILEPEILWRGEYVKSWSKWESNEVDRFSVLMLSSEEEKNPWWGKGL